MDINEAIRFLDPETTVKAIAEVEYYGGFNGKEKAIQKISESCDVAVAVMHGYQEMCNLLQEIESLSANEESLCADKIVKDFARVKDSVLERLSNVSDKYIEDEKEI